MLLSEDWSVKLCDFGLARYKDRFVKDNHGKIGTPHWMAPEILRGERYTEAADVYSFGVVLWEMLAQEIPYHGRSNAQITGLVGYHKEKLQLDPEYPSANSSTSLKKQSVYMKLRKIINNCLLFEPERRPGFADIISYIERIELKKGPEPEGPSAIIGKLNDFLLVTSPAITSSN